jgi:hypothetical protein
LSNQEIQKIEERSLDSSNVNSIKEGIIFSRRVVRDKPIYEYTLTILGNPSDTSILKGLVYAHNQVENIIVLKKVEDKVLDLKAEKCNE